MNSSNSKQSSVKSLSANTAISNSEKNESRYHINNNTNSPKNDLKNDIVLKLKRNNSITPKAGVKVNLKSDSGIFSTKNDKIDERYSKKSNKNNNKNNYVNRRKSNGNINLNKKKNADHQINTLTTTGGTNSNNISKRNSTDCNDKENYENRVILINMPKRKKKTISASKLPITKSIPVKRNERSFFEKVMINLGITRTDVVVKNKEALEVIRHLNLNKSHLKKLRRRFDEIDLDGSGD